jgi:hypothetical protein
MPQVKKTEVSKAVDSLFPALNADESSKIVAWSTLADSEADGKMAMIDVFVMNKREPSHFIGFAKSETDPAALALRDSIVLNIIKGWKNNADALKLYKADVASLDMKQQADKSFYEGKYQESYYNFRKAFNTRFEKSQAGASAGKKKPAKDDVQALRLINQAINKLSGIKGGYAGMVEDIKALKALSIMTKVIDLDPPKKK